MDTNLPKTKPKNVGVGCSCGDFRCEYLKEGRILKAMTAICSCGDPKCDYRYKYND